MIFVHDTGRMCNNILQYANLYAWGREHKRKTMSMRFSYKYPYFHICDTPPHNLFTYLIAKYAAKLKIIPTVRFDRGIADYSKEEELMLSKNNVYVTGWYAYWYDLFLKYKEEIISLFTFHQEIEKRVSEIMENDDNLKLGIHIRRGDYATFEGGRNYFSDEQYMTFIQSFLNLYPDRKVSIYICGNDPELNKDYYIHCLPNSNVVFPCGSPGEDLCLLSHCDYLIGARSTFSLVASLYRDIPIYWIEDPLAKFTKESFRDFEYYFKDIH